MFPINLSWKSFSVNLQAIETWMRANAGSNYRGNSAQDGGFTLWFTQDPGSDVAAAIMTYWDGLLDSSTEATEYQSSSDIKTTKAASLASAQSKLSALGLTQDEINALVGN